MSHQARIQEIVDRLHGLNEVTGDLCERIIREIQRESPRAGFDDEGRLRVAFFDAKGYDCRSFEARLKERGVRDQVTLQFHAASLGPDTLQLIDGAKVVCVFVNDVCNAEVVRALSDHGVEMIALRCAGYNNVDLEACAEEGIDVVRVPGYSPYAVAEHTVALMLMLNRHLHQAYLRNRAGYFVLEGLTGFDMRGKIVGVLGTGRIGQCLIEILGGFGCDVLAYDVHPCPKIASLDFVRYVELPELFAHSDIITLHLPLFPETQYLINQAAIRQMKDGVMLINTSRGGLVDTKALIEGLKSGKIGSAGLDVYEEEAGIFFHDMSDKVLTDDVLARLMTFNNVVITSHQAFLTQEALHNIADTTLDNLLEFVAGRRGEHLTHRVSPPSA